MRAEAHGTGEDGYTLVEVLVAIVILGLAFVASMGGLATSITVTDYHRQESQVETVLGSAAEKVKALDYVNCATPSTYESEADSAAPAGWPPNDITVKSVQYWNWTTNAYGSMCMDDISSLSRLQLVTIEVDHPGGRVIHRELSVAKSG